MFKPSSCPARYSNFLLRPCYGTQTKHFSQSSVLHFHITSPSLKSSADAPTENIETSTTIDPNEQQPANLNSNHPNDRPYGLHSTADAKDLILSVLRSTATKREAKQYISRYTPLIGRDAEDISKKRETVQKILKEQKPKGSAGDFFGNYSSPSETTDTASESFEITNLLRVAIIKIRDMKSIDAETLTKIGNMLNRLTKLGVSPIVVIDAGKERNDFLQLDNQPFRNYQKEIIWKAATMANIIENASSDGSVRARPVEGLFEFNNDYRKVMHEENTSTSTTDSTTVETTKPSASGESQPVSSHPFKDYVPIDTSLATKLKFAIPNLILLPLSHGIIPVVVPLAYDPTTSEEKLISADDALVFLVSELTKTSKNILSIEKIIFIDPIGGIPSIERSGSHVFVNLHQELDDIIAELHLGFIDPTTREINLANLKTMNKALSLLPSSTVTGLITTPSIASLSSSSQNPIIYNILTDRPIMSPSLPVVKKKSSTISTTILRRGMPVFMMKSMSGIDLIKESKLGNIDLPRLWTLIEDSFKRKLDAEHYLKRINGKVAGIIIAGDYEGAAIITWEEPPNISLKNYHNAVFNMNNSEQDSSEMEEIDLENEDIAEEQEPQIISELDRINMYAAKKQYKRVAYLDKFAVKSSAQGAAGVADIIFKSMVMTMFPEELLWRSRQNNPVNKWYFERSRGTLKLNGIKHNEEGLTRVEQSEHSKKLPNKWCMFWTGSNTREKHNLDEYMKICMSIQPSWSD